MGTARNENAELLNYVRHFSELSFQEFENVGKKMAVDYFKILDCNAPARSKIMKTQI
jgi:hypothetical protein